MKIIAQQHRQNLSELPRAKVPLGERPRVEPPLPAVSSALRLKPAEEQPIGRVRVSRSSIQARPSAPAQPLTAVPLEHQRRTFRRVQGPQINAILVSPEAQAHAVVDNHPLKRHVVLSQPSGNVGAGWWWSSQSIKAFEVPSEPQPVVKDGLAGVKLELTADAKGSFKLEAPILDSVRAIRDRLGEGSDERVALREEGAKAGLVPTDAIRPRAVEASEHHLVLERSGVAGTHKHRLEIRGLDGTKVQRSSSGEIEISSKGKPSVEVTYLTDLPAFTPFAPLDFLNERARERLETEIKQLDRGLLSADEQSELKLVCRALEDLSAMVFKEKAVAGGWRFLTYFGRDTLQTVTMLRPLLDPSVVEAVFQAALGRISKRGEVAHEEDLADQAEHIRLQQAMSGEAVPDRTKWSEPVYDYKMVDDDFMLASAIAEYLSDPAIPAERKRSFLEAPNGSDGTNIEAIGKNLTYISQRATGYADSVRRGMPDVSQLIEDPDPKALIKLFDGNMVGDWRDSDVGLGFGRYPASINLELVPTALEKASAMIDSLESIGYDPKAWAPDVAKSFDPKSTAAPSAKLADMADRWRHARKHFEVVISPAEITARFARFLKNQTSDEARKYFGAVDLGGATVADIAAGKTIPKHLEEGWRFSAVSLDKDTKPVPVMSSDGFFGLPGSSLREDALKEVARLVTTPYPLGLATPAGLLISNPVLAGNDAIDEVMSPGRYHGTVVWTWLEALGLAAISHQRNAARAEGRIDLMRAAEKAIRAIDEQVSGEGDLQTLELHGWEITKTPEGPKMTGKPFEGADNESLEAWPGNATQLWATALPLVRWGARQRLM